MAADGAKGAGLSRAHAALARRLGERLAESLLPGEAPLGREHLSEASRFVLEAAMQRRAGEPSIALRSAPGGRVMRIALVNDDMPFLVDSVAATIAAHGL